MAGANSGSRATVAAISPRAMLKAFPLSPEVAFAHSNQTFKVSVRVINTDIHRTAGRVVLQATSIGFRRALADSVINVICFGRFFRVSGTLTPPSNAGRAEDQPSNPLPPTLATRASIHRRESEQGRDRKCAPRPVTTLRLISERQLLQRLHVSRVQFDSAFKLRVASSQLPGPALNITA